MARSGFPGGDRDAGWLTPAWRRALFFGLTAASAGIAGFLMFDIVRANRLTGLELIGLILFVASFTWIAGAFWTALAGFVIALKGRDALALGTGALAGRRLATRTALVMPIHNEEAARVIAGLDAIWRSLADQPDAGAFDLFILSDTRAPEIARAEEAGWAALVAAHGAAGRIFYRRRRENSGRKAGNIADFVRRWGADYDHLLVLDADSVMTGEAIVTLARLMEAHPDAGIIQTLPMPAGRDTLFARLIQFAARLNGPMLAHGLAFWQMGEANYWGHNAIIRMRPFARFCALPRLAGPAPVGGEILSHDFVEAAMMRRAGYKVWLAADIAGSWEEVPTNVLDYANRDRRWIQGNLQHLGVVPWRGLHWISRVHMLTGVMGYLASPIWLLLLLVSSLVIAGEAIHGHTYFASGYSLFPTWPEARDSEIALLLGLTLVILFLPKLLGLALALLQPHLRRAFGGGRRLLASLALEQVFSVLLAPSMMVFHTVFVARALLGRPASWQAQPRSERGVGWREALHRHKGHLALGLSWGALILGLAPAYIWWLAPVIMGLVLAPWLTVATSRRDFGVRWRRQGLLLTPEETTPPWELRDACAAKASLAPALVEDAAMTPPQAPLAMEAQAPRYVALGAAARRLALRLVLVLRRPAWGRR
ncbi:MAG: glucans biosynthesis glucosyltransferase MdoH [Pseudomonadota bacterium]